MTAGAIESLPVAGITRPSRSQRRREGLSQGSMVHRGPEGGVPHAAPSPVRVPERAQPNEGQRGQGGDGLDGGGQFLGDGPCGVPATITRSKGRPSATASRSAARASALLSAIARPMPHDAR